MHAGSSELAGMQHKRWEAHKFAQLADKLADTYNAEILLFGAPSEDNLKQEIMQSMQHKAHNVITPTVRTAATLMSHCNLFAFAKKPPDEIHKFYWAYQ